MEATPSEIAVQRPTAADAPRDTRRGGLIMIGVLLGMLLASLDQTIVGTAMPRVIAELHGLEHYAWVFTAYMLASTVSVPIYGKLSDIYGRRPFFLAGMIIFLAGSALCGVAQDMTQLILFRGIQGLGAGAMMPIAIAIIGDIFSPAERGKWQGLMMAIFGLSSIVGPVLGGWLTDGWGWRWVFYVNMPVGLIAIVTAGLVLPRQIHRRDHQIDFLGAATLVAGTTPLLLAFSWAGVEHAWNSPQIIGLVTIALVLLAVFIRVEFRAAEPIISPNLFHNRVFTVSVISMFLTTAGMFGTIMYLPLFIQGVLGTSAADSGLVLTPMMVGFMVSSIIGGQILARTGRYKIPALAGFTIAGIGMFLLSRMTVDADNLLVIRNMLVTGLGIGVMMSLFTIVVQNAFPRERLGEATASLQFFRSIGGTIGVAILGSVMSNRFQMALQGNMPATLTQAVPPAQLAALQNPQVLLAPEATTEIQRGFAELGPRGQVLFEQLMLAIRQSLATSITDLFLVSCVAMALAFVVTLFLPEIPLRKDRPGQQRASSVVAEATEPFAEGANEWAPATSPASSPTARDQGGSARPG